MSAPTVAPHLLVFVLPDLGEGLTEAQLVSWLVAEGDTVAVDQPVAEVETAKSVVEVPSPFAGTVAVLHGRPGEVLDVGAPFLSVRPEAVAPEPGTEAAPSACDGAGVPADVTGADDDATGAPRATEGSGNVLIGYGTPGGLPAGRKRPRKGTTTTAVPSPVPVPAAAQAPPGSTADTGTQGGAAPICVSPLVRKLARDSGLRLAELHGSGEKGLILRRDVERALSTTTLAPGVPDAAPSGAGTATGTPATTGATPTTGTAAPIGARRDSRSGLAVLGRTPLTGVRRTIADAVSRSRREIPEATVWVDVDITALVELREGMKRTTPDAVPGVLAFVARFVVAGLLRHPDLNSRIVTGEDGAQELVRVDGINLGIAAQSDRGLVVPSIRRADTMSARRLDAEIRRLTALARAGEATPSDLSSGTFTLNNYGVFGVDGSAAIINHPEAAMLGMGRIIDRPWVVDGQLAVRKVTELTLVFDHRVCDGGTAGGFLRFVADAMENPGAVLAGL